MQVKKIRDAHDSGIFRLSDFAQGASHIFLILTQLNVCAPPGRHDHLSYHSSGMRRSHHVHGYDPCGSCCSSFSTSYSRATASRASRLRHLCTTPEAHDVLSGRCREWPARKPADALPAPAPAAEAPLVCDTLGREVQGSSADRTSWGLTRVERGCRRRGDSGLDCAWWPRFRCHNAYIVVSRRRPDQHQHRHRPQACRFLLRHRHRRLQARARSGTRIWTLLRLRRWLHPQKLSRPKSQDGTWFLAPDRCRPRQQSLAVRKVRKDFLPPPLPP